MAGLRSIAAAVSAPPPLVVETSRQSSRRDLGAAVQKEVQVEGEAAGEQEAEETPAFPWSMAPPEATK